MSEILSSKNGSLLMTGDLLVTSDRVYVIVSSGKSVTGDGFASACGFEGFGTEGGPEWVHSIDTERFFYDEEWAVR